MNRKVAFVDGGDRCASYTIVARGIGLGRDGGSLSTKGGWKVLLEPESRFFLAKTYSNGFADRPLRVCSIIKGGKEVGAKR